MKHAIRAVSHVHQVVLAALSGMDIQEIEAEVQAICGNCIRANTVKVGMASPCEKFHVL